MIFLGMGSNLGDREENIAAALRLLLENGDIRIEAVSSLYETEPVGLKEQPAFLNCVIQIAAELTPHDLLTRCLKIESCLGRIRTERWGPRLIDIDILFFKGLHIVTDTLQLPHPRLMERNFVLVPLVEIAGDKIICKGLTASQLLENSADVSTVSFYKEIKEIRAE